MKGIMFMRKSILQTVIDMYAKDYQPTAAQIDAVDELYKDCDKLDAVKYYEDAPMIIGEIGSDPVAMETIPSACKFGRHKMRGKIAAIFLGLLFICIISLPFICEMVLTSDCYTRTEEIISIVINKENIPKPQTRVVDGKVSRFYFTTYRLYFEDGIYSDTTESIYSSTNIGDHICLYKITTYRKNNNSENDEIQEVRYEVKTDPLSASP